jgi:hypothetical protein
MGPSVRKRIQNYEYKIYKYKYLFIKRKEATTNYKFKKAAKYQKHHRIQKNNIIILLMNCLTHSIILNRLCIKYLTLQISQKKTWTCEHIASAPPRALERIHVSEGPVSLGFINFTVIKRIEGLE